MRYYSTSNPEKIVNMRDAVTSCVPADGGLYMPAALPMIPGAFVQNACDMSLREIAYVTTNVFLGEDINSQQLKTIVDNALNFKVPLVQIDKDTFVLELFHGPKGVFKDIGARFLAELFNAMNPHDGTKLNILVATNGNTGVAVANAFAGKDDINVFILFPHGSVKKSDIASMSDAADNIHPLEIGGTIDDCKSMIADAFSDKTLRESLLLSTANSTNFARLIPQVAVYFYAAGRLKALGVDPACCSIAVPCGNLGMLTSGLLAMHIGLSVGQLVAGCNANNAFDRYMTSGELVTKPTVKTFARLMDMASPSNLPRWAALNDGKRDRVGENIVSATVTDAEIASAIRHTDLTDGYIMDPHTAVGMVALNRNRKAGSPGLVFATASPDRSPEIMSKILGMEVSERSCASSSHRPIVRLAPTYPALKKYILSHQ